MAKILVAGASYGSYTGEGSWIKYLKEYTNYEVNTVSTDGMSNYVIFDRIKKHNNSEYEYLIVLLTPHTRIPVVNGYPELCTWVPDDPGLTRFWNIFWSIHKDEKMTPYDYENAVRGYLKYFHNDDFLRWTNKNIIRDIEESLLPNQKVIWVITGLDRVIFDNIKTGIKVIGSLIDITELESKALSLKKRIITWSEDDSRRNHLCKENQELLAKFFTKIIQTPEAELTLDDLNLHRVKWVTDIKLLEKSFNGDYE